MYSVGDKVQTYDKKHNVRDGVVVSVTPAKMERPADYWKLSDEAQMDTYDSVLIKFDDGAEESVCERDVDGRDSDLEREFRLTARTADDKIQAYLDEASDALRKATALSEALGVPFNSNISFLSQCYFPRSFGEKFDGINSSFVSDITQTYNEYDRSYGWEHSAVC